MKHTHENSDKFFGLDAASPTTPQILLGVVIILWLACGIGCYFLLQPPAGAGEFGDMFGAVNALFSGLAFAGLIITILLQKQELRAQREELRLNTEALMGQKEELEAQRKEFQIQNSMLKRQTFEATFFNSLNGMQGIVSHLNQTHQKSKYFEYKYAELNTKYNRPDGRPVLDNLRNFYYDNEWEFGHYFRNVVMLVHLVDLADLDDDLKSFYMTILKARMSNDELRMFLYFVIYELGTRDGTPDTVTHKERLRLQGAMKRHHFFDGVRTRPAVGLIHPEHDWELLRQLTFERID
jgi:hypothetical protein